MRIRPKAKSYKEEAIESVHKFKSVLLDILAAIDEFESGDMEVTDGLALYRKLKNLKRQMKRL